MLVCMADDRDPRYLRALAHPLRWKLLDLLRQEGTATVTACAVALGESTASCSYHLGMLAKYGYIEPAPAIGREKPWRLADHDGPVSLLPQGPGAEEALASQAAMESWVDHESAELKDFYLRRRDLEPPAWLAALRVASQATWLTTDQARDVGERLMEVFRDAAAREDEHGRPPGARLVRLFAAMTLSPEDP